MHPRRIPTSLVRRLVQSEETPARARRLGSQLSPLRQQAGRGSIPKGQFAFEDKEMLEILASGTTRSMSGEDPADSPAFLASTKKYFAALAKNPSMTAAALEQAYGLPPSELLRLGAMIIAGSENPRYWKLGTQMLVTASAAGYMPATLSLIRFFASLGDEGLSARMYLDSLKRLMAYLKTSTGRKDPDALTVAAVHTIRFEGHEDWEKSAAGLFMEAIRAGSPGETKFGFLTVAGLQDGWTTEREGWEKAALRFFLEAIRAASESGSPRGAPTDLRGGDEPRPARWLTEPDCYVGLGHLCMQLELYDLAYWAFRIAALELDVPMAYSALAIMLPEEAPEREVYLTKAAISDEQSAMPVLAKVLRQKAAREPVGGEGPALLRMAREWEAIGSDDSGDQNSAAVAA